LIIKYFIAGVIDLLETVCNGDTEND